MKPGLRDELITHATLATVKNLGDRAKREALDPAEAPSRLTRHVASILERELDARGTPASTEAVTAIANEILAGLDKNASVIEPPELLTGIIGDSRSGFGSGELPPRPELPLSTSDLLFGGIQQPRLGSELKAELASAESVDLISAFIVRSGVVIFRDELRELCARGGRLRVLTSPYLGVTDPNALELLLELGAEIRLSYEPLVTKLHAKSWVINRPGGISTAFVGSSNLSHTAMQVGMEWNVRLSEADSALLIDRIRLAFETTWEGEHFEPYESKDRERLELALDRANPKRQRDDAESFIGLSLVPFRHQERALEQLEIARERHDRHRNLFVAATGTGKTVVSALDYAALCEKHGKRLSLLFVAHRREILEQARRTFRHALQDANFGEILDGSSKPKGEHVFAMIQTLRGPRINALPKDQYEVVVVDEFHHAAASSYIQLLEHVEPIELVGMTATPFRADGRDITCWFEGRIAYELPLWEAIDQGFLCPFQYFGVTDDTDMQDLEWSGGDYRNIDSVVTGNTIRADQSLRAIHEYVDRPSELRALGFCASVAHAEFMAEHFSQRGTPSAFLSGETPKEERDRILADLANGRVSVVFSVDVLGEGVDVPSVNTVLLLRPTQSATVLTQQIGRGLRRHASKRCLTVIDLIGNHRKEFRSDAVLKALLAGSKGSVQKQAEAGFPYLPSGCDIVLERVAKERLLASLKRAQDASRWPILAADLREFGDVSMLEFVTEFGIKPGLIYGRGSSQEKCWSALRERAGFETALGGSDEENKLLRALGRMLYIDDVERIVLYTAVLADQLPPELSNFDVRQQRLLKMLHFNLWGSPTKFESFEAGFEALWQHRSVRDELAELLATTDALSKTISRPSGLAPEFPLNTHAKYSQKDILTALGDPDADALPRWQEGVKRFEDAKTDAFLITIHKAERDYSPTTMYQDVAVSPSILQWQSQSNTSAESRSGRRYISHQANGDHILLFARLRKTDAFGQTAPYLFLGPGMYLGHHGDRPMTIQWKLSHPLPDEWFEQASSPAA